MGICRQIRGYSRRHEWVGNLFSLAAVALIFATVWGSLKYHQLLIAWLSHNPVLNAALLAAAIAFEALLIVLFLAIGSSRADEEEEHCFASFKGRRGESLGLFRSWVSHMENVGKKHR
jgi:chromate transport protein ChrA